MLRYYRANSQYRNSLSFSNQWSLQPGSRPPRNAGWLWLVPYNIEGELGRDMQNKSNSLRSRQAATQFFPGMKFRMKNNVCSSRNQISGLCLTLDLESRGLSVLSAPRWHRHHQLLLLMSNQLVENTLKPVALCVTYFVWKEESFSLTLPVTFQSPSSQSKEIRRKWNNVPCIPALYGGKKVSIKQKLIQGIF